MYNKNSIIWRAKYLQLHSKSLPLSSVAFSFFRSGTMRQNDTAAEVKRTTIIEGMLRDCGHAGGGSPRSPLCGGPGNGWHSRPSWGKCEGLRQSMSEY